MGIQGLLPLLKSIMSPIHIEDLRGRTVAVDTYSWLHKGALACSAQLCKGLPTTKARKENLERAMLHEESGNNTAAFECYQKAVDISPSIAYELIQVLKQEKVDYIVAPYEADAQMTFLSVNKLVDAVITEDSDLIPFGCSRVSRELLQIIFKMDRYGHGVEFQSSKLGQNKDLNFTGFTKQMLLEMCICSGCDYLQSLPGMGLKRAHALVQKLKSFEKVIKHLKYSAICIPPLYEESFKKAMWAFQHQRVYDPAKEDIVHLSDIPLGLDQDLEFLGPWLPKNVVKGIAKGDLDPLTKMPFQAKETCTQLAPEKSWSVKEFVPANGRKKLDLPVQKNILTNYFCLASLEAKRKFRAPKVMPKQLETMDSSSPSSVIHVSDSPASAEDAATCTVDQPQGSILDSENSKDESPSRNSVEDMFSYRSSKCLSLYEKDNSSLYPCSLMEPENDTSKSHIMSHKEDGCHPALHVPESNTKSENRKVIVKSKYFQHKLLDENNKQNQSNVPIVNERDVSEVLGYSLVSKSASPRNGYQISNIKKRKLIHVHAEHKGNFPETPVLEAGSHTTNLNNKAVDVKAEGNVGCDISHLNNYSGIAEKSMERFASIISSFRYTSPGSRASGLRAPLKDVQNTCTVRPTTGPIDFSKYRYIPGNKKTSRGLSAGKTGLS